MTQLQTAILNLMKSSGEIKQYDVIVIGAGSGGLTAAVGFKNIGKSVLLVEKEHMGGECTNTGCIPSKSLLYQAKKYHAAKEVAGSANNLEEYRNSVLENVRNKIADILSHETPEAFKKLGIDVIMGEAIFKGPRSISVSEHHYTFKKAVIATGSSPRMFPIDGLNEQHLLTNQNIFNLKNIPEQLLIIGSGPIGMELGQAFAMLGSRVTIATIDARFAKFEDEEITPIIEKEFTDLGIKILKHAHVVGVTNTHAHIEIRSDQETIEEKIDVPFDKILMAIGREPNFPQGLDEAGISFDQYTINTNSHYRTTNRHVYAVGDVSLRQKFTHTADDAARHVVKKVLLPFSLPKRFRQVPKVTYTHPEIAAVGLSYKEAVDRFGKGAIIKLSVPFSKNDRAITDNATENGLAIVVAKKITGKILGVNIIGQSAGEILSFFTLAMERNVSLWKVNTIVFPYPTISLIIKKVSDEYLSYSLPNLKKDLLGMIKRNGTKIFALLFWAAIVTTFFSYKSMHGLSFLDMAKFIGDLNMSVWGPLAFILIYAMRPLIFFPATLLTMLSGVLFGLWGGILYTIIGENLSANVAYWVGRFFGGDIKLPEGIVKHFRDEARANSFMTVLIARFIYMPFDLTNYASGIMKIKWSSYALATIIGIIPGMTTFVALGASFQSITEFDPSMIHADPKTLALSAVLFVSSLLLAQFIKKRQNT